MHCLIFHACPQFLSNNRSVNGYSNEVDSVQSDKNNWNAAYRHSLRRLRLRIVKMELYILKPNEGLTIVLFVESSSFRQVH